LRRYSEWASEFRQEQETAAREASEQQGQTRTEVQAETAAQSARLAATLAANPDPKFQNSQFLQFMSRWGCTSSRIQFTHSLKASDDPTLEPIK
jgi:hypothetical protein